MLLSVTCTPIYNGVRHQSGRSRVSPQQILTCNDPYHCEWAFLIDCYRQLPQEFWIERGNRTDSKKVENSGFEIFLMHTWIQSPPNCILNLFSLLKKTNQVFFFFFLFKLNSQTSLEFPRFVELLRTSLNTWTVTLHISCILLKTLSHAVP